MSDDAPARGALDPTGRLRALARDAFLAGPSLPEPNDVEGAKVYRLTGRFEVAGPAVIAIGAFDGVHRGHARLIELASEDARRRGVPLALVTFDPDPSQVLGAGGPGSLLLSSADRLRALAHLGPDALVAFDFDHRFAALGYDEFVTERLLGLVDPIAVHVGRDFALGRGREGSLDTLEVLLGSLDIPVFGHELVVDRGAPISATRIRALVVAGEVARARELLGRAPFVRGVVAHGRGEGASLGFPTANVRFDRTFAFPSSGVYAGICRVGERAWSAAVNLGEPPTFDGHVPEGDVALAEAALVAFDGDLYGREVEVALVERLRASVTFDSVEELRKTVLGNLDQTRELLGTSAVEVAG